MTQINVTVCVLHFRNKGHGRPNDSSGECSHSYQSYTRLGIEISHCFERKVISTLSPKYLHTIVLTLKWWQCSSESVITVIYTQGILTFERRNENQNEPKKIIKFLPELHSTHLYHSTLHVSSHHPSLQISHKTHHIDSYISPFLSQSTLVIGQFQVCVSLQKSKILFFKKENRERRTDMKKDYQSTFLFFHFFFFKRRCWWGSFSKHRYQETFEVHGGRRRLEHSKNEREGNVL